MADTKIGNQSHPAAICAFEAVYEDGVLKPLQDPGLPEHHRFSVQVREPLDLQELNDLDTWSRDMDALATAIPPEDFVRLDEALAEADKVDAADIKAWSQEIAAAADRIPAEEHERFLTALAEVKKEAKEQVRRAWGLA